MKTAPQDAEFARFTNAMRQILRVSKMELSERLKAEKRKLKSPASRDAAVSSATSQAHQP
jgi:hypothetical protein